MCIERCVGRKRDPVIEVPEYTDGFVVASLILAAATVVDLLRSGSYQSMVFAALIFSQLAFWGSRLYYDRGE